MDLAGRLRERRAASGRTIASVAADAGLSVPYIANLENGRGNPTVAALSRLAEALGLRLVVDLAPAQPTETHQEPTPTVVRFARSTRFHDEATRLADKTHIDEQDARQRLLALLTAAQAITGDTLSTTDCHRFLDAVALATRDL